MHAMNYKIGVLGLGLLSGLAACNAGSGGTQGGSDVDSSSLAPVETRAANTNYQPAFSGQTRIAGMKTSTALDIQVINDALEQPWAITTLPDGRFLITQNKGTMVILKPDGSLDKTITGLPQVEPAGQGGLLDVTPAPDFASSRMIFWGFSEAQASGGMLHAIAKGRLSDAETSIENIEVIYRATPAHTGTLQYGGRIVFDPAGNLFVSLGERSDAEIRVQAQDLNSALGKIIHIDQEGNPVPDGPFSNTENARPEIYAYGFRNPDGLAIHPETGDLWEAEFGPQGGDELNRIQSGKNYGWPVITYGQEYSGEQVGEGIQQKEGMEQPVYYWDPVISPGGMTFYEGDLIPEWKGNLFIGGLSGQHIARLKIENNKVVGEERLLEGKEERFRALTTGADGALYAVTDGGNLYRIGKQEGDQ